MKKIFLMAALPLLLGACATVDLAGCDKLGGPKSVTIKYGDEGITVVPSKKVQRRSLFIIKLKPTSDDYKDDKVIIDGITVAPGGAGVAGPDWLDTDDDYDTRKKFVYCSPDLPNDTEQRYKYSVKVEGLGEIDPRVDVTF